MRAIVRVGSENGVRIKESLKVREVPWMIEPETPRVIVRVGVRVRNDLRVSVGEGKH